jgi:hypothetical protein
MLVMTIELVRNLAAALAEALRLSHDANRKYPYID